MSIYESAVFTVSSSKLDNLPPASVPEIAFAGRSNAGKSTAINTLTRQGKLAFASKTPAAPSSSTSLSSRPRTR